MYTDALAMVLTALFDLRQIAALGAIYYLIMDVAIHYGTLRHLRDRVPVRRWVLVTAMILDVLILDVLILGASVWVKASTDVVGLAASGAGIVIIVLGERVFMRSHTNPDGSMDM